MTRALCSCVFSTVNSFPLPNQRPLRKRSFGSGFCLFGSFGFVSGSAPVVVLGRAVLNLSGECRYAISTVRFCGGIFSWRRTVSIFAAPTVLPTLLPVRLKCNTTFQRRNSSNESTLPRSSCGTSGRGTKSPRAGSGSRSEPIGRRAHV